MVSLLLIVVSSIAILQFETVPESNIKGAQDALWWAISTITTVGYGDRFPVTIEGRLVASFLMICGVGLFGTLSGFVASWFLKPTEELRDTELAVLIAEVRELRAAIARQSV
jgi:voltage-gated potassium channel